MANYVAFLGHQPHVSLAELRGCIDDFRLETMVSDRIALFATAMELSMPHVRQLGGTVAIGKQIGTVPVSAEEIPALLAAEVASLRGKVTFSLRTWNVPRRTIHNLYRECKRYLKNRGRPSRYVGTEYEPASSVILHQMAMVDGKDRRGCELVLIAMGEDGLWVGRTVGIQDIDAYTQRDMEKPVRDTGVGLLPPKLAQVLLNLGTWLVREKYGRLGGPAEKSSLLVYDPFCGTGVIPMECLLQGWPVLASDISLKAVNGATKNLDWIRKVAGIAKRDVPSAVWKQDAGKPFDFSAAKRVGITDRPDVIVTETTLGPPFSAQPTVREAERSRSEVERTEAEFLRNARACLPGTPVACAWPVWFTSKGPVRLEKIWSVLAELKFTAILPPGTQPSEPRRTSLLYQRPDQFVGREIVLLAA